MCRPFVVLLTPEVCLDVTSCRLVETCRRFVGTYCLCLQSKLRPAGTCRMHYHVLDQGRLENYGVHVSLCRNCLKRCFVSKPVLFAGGASVALYLVRR